MVLESGDTDDDLTNLNWLQANNILDLIPCDLTRSNNLPVVSSSSTDGECVTTEDDAGYTSSIIPPVVVHSSDGDKLIHQRHGPLSLSSLIFMAIDSSPNKMLPIKQIYAWIIVHFSSYRTVNPSWKRAIRKQLYRSECFRQFTPIDQLTGTSDSTTERENVSWFVDPLLKPSLVAAVKRSSFHINPLVSRVNRLTNINVNERVSNWSIRSQVKRKQSNPNGRVNKCSTCFLSSDLVCSSACSYDADDEEDAPNKHTNISSHKQTHM